MLVCFFVLFAESAGPSSLGKCAREETTAKEPEVRARGLPCPLDCQCALACERASASTQTSTSVSHCHA